jgi:putative GTP pyrophosphokinase
MNYIERYKQLKPIYESFAQGLNVLLKSILEASNIKFHLVESRAKEIDSFKNKIEAKRGKYKDPLKEVMDLCGIRIIVYYQTDIDKIDKLIRDNFEVDLLNSIDKSKILKSNEFGYLSNHYIIRINSVRSHLPEWQKFQGLNAEIQLRTVLQHSWAAISHELEYKSKLDIPDILKRKLFRLAGLFELADEEFVQVKQRQFELTKAIEKKAEFENTSVYNEVNLDTVKYYFDERVMLVNQYWELGKKAGFSEGQFDIDERNPDSSYSSIVRISKFLNIYTIDKLNELLEKAKEFAGEYLKLQFLEHIKRSDHNDGEPVWYADGIFMINLVLMSQLDNDELDYFIPTDWSKEILERVKNVVVKWRKKNILNS